MWFSDAELTADTSSSGMHRNLLLKIKILPAAPEIFKLDQICVKVDVFLTLKLSDGVYVDLFDLTVIFHFVILGKYRIVTPFVVIIGPPPFSRLSRHFSY